MIIPRLSKGASWYIIPSETWGWCGSIGSRRRGGRGLGRPAVAPPPWAGLSWSGFLCQHCLLL